MAPAAGIHFKDLSAPPSHLAPARDGSSSHTSTTPSHHRQAESSNSTPHHRHNDASTHYVLYSHNANPARSRRKSSLDHTSSMNLPAGSRTRPRRRVDAVNLPQTQGDETAENVSAYEVSISRFTSAIVWLLKNCLIEMHRLDTIFHQNFAE